MADTPKKIKKNPLDLLMNLMEIIGSVLLLAITFIVTYSVILRYINIKPPIWVLQYTEYGLLWMTLLGAAGLQRLDGHIRIDTVVTNLPESVQSKPNVINSFLGCVVTLIIFYFATLHTIDLFQRGIMEVKATIVPKYLMFCVIPFGSLILFFQFVRDTWNNIRREFKN